MTTKKESTVVNNFEKTPTRKFHLRILIVKKATSGDFEINGTNDTN